MKINTEYSNIPLIWCINWHLRTAVPRSEVLLTPTSGTCIYSITILGYLNVMLPAQSFFPSRILLGFHKLVLTHILVASQATSRSHHLFGTICSITVKSICIMLYVAQATLCSRYCNGLKRSTDE